MLVDRCTRDYNFYKSAQSLRNSVAFVHHFIPATINLKRQFAESAEANMTKSLIRKRKRRVGATRIYQLRSSTKNQQSANLNEEDQENDVSDVDQYVTAKAANNTPIPQRSRKIDSSFRVVDNFISDDDKEITDGSTTTTPELLNIVTLREQLLEWYLNNYRELPWRAAPRYQGKNKDVLPLHTPDKQSTAGAPYAVWISEVMSQQTRITVVVEYFKRWMQEFPTIEVLAHAPLDRVNELWAGLGYYRRARFLHEGAQQVVDTYNGSIPSDVPSLLKLKGIGQYTAGAISSIAFGKSVPAVDGNVERVFSRLIPQLSTSDDAKALSKKYWELAQSCVNDIECAGDFNQALMDFGATVCKPKAPICSECPLQNICGAYSEGRKLGSNNIEEYVTRYPVKKTKSKAKVREEEIFVSVICVKGTKRRKYLVTQRPEKGLLAGLWEAPNTPIKDATAQGFKKAQISVEKIIKEACVDVSERDSSIFDNDRNSYRHVTKLTHIFSHIRQKLHVTELTVQCTDGILAALFEGKTNNGTSFRWISPSEVDSIAISTQMKKVFAAVAP